MVKDQGNLSCTLLEHSRFGVHKHIAAWPAFVLVRLVNRYANALIEKGRSPKSESRLMVQLDLECSQVNKRK